MMKKTILFTGLLSAAFTASATTVTAKVVADDFYSVYVGSADGTSLSRVGGSNGALWWSQGGQFTFNVASGDYIYVAAWDSASYGAPHMWIGEFNIGSTTLVSNLTDWVSKYDVSVKDPTLSQVQALIQSSMAWGSLGVSAPDGGSTYGNLSPDNGALNVWHDSFWSDSASFRGYALFRTAMTAIPNGPTDGTIPLPGTALLILPGLAMLGFIRRRHTNQGRVETPT